MKSVSMQKHPMPDIALKCEDCGKELKPVGVERGYAVRIEKEDGAKVPHNYCYTCAALYERMDMLSYGTWTGYLHYPEGATRDALPITVQNWSGFLSFYISKVYRNKNLSGWTRTDIWFRGPNGDVWLGTCKGGGDLVECHRTKLKSIPVTK